MEYFGLGFACVIAGAILGKSLEAAKWRKNADNTFRIFSKNRLYKVYHDSPSSSEPKLDGGRKA